MIEIITWDGVAREAETPEAAVYAAKIGWEEAVRSRTTGKPVVNFYVDGKLVASFANKTAINQYFREAT